MCKLIFNFLFRTKRRWMTVLALWISAVARFRVHFSPGRYIHRFLGEKGKETPEDQEFTGKQLRNLGWVADRVNRVANRTPWESKCLVRGMVAQRLLRYYGLDSTLYLGVGRDENQKMIAHAWLRCGPFYITGGNGENYATVAKFKY